MLSMDESLKLGRWQVDRFNEKRARKKADERSGFLFFVHRDAVM